jgi:hypothetical protein
LICQVLRPLIFQCRDGGIEFNDDYAATVYVVDGSKPEPLPGARMSASRKCRQDNLFSWVVKRWQFPSSCPPRPAAPRPRRPRYARLTLSLARDDNALYHEANAPPPQLQAPAPLPCLRQADRVRRQRRRSLPRLVPTISCPPRRMFWRHRLAPRLPLLDGLLLAATPCPAAEGTHAHDRLQSLRGHLPDAAP